MPTQTEQTLAIRESQKQSQRLLTDEWKKRGADDWQDYARLNNDVSIAATGKHAKQRNQELGTTIAHERQ